jgi:hypothetical protein
VGDETVCGERTRRGVASVAQPLIFRTPNRRQGVADLSKITAAELDAYLVLLRRADHGVPS